MTTAYRAYVDRSTQTSPWPELNRDREAQEGLLPSPSSTSHGSYDEQTGEQEPPFAALAIPPVRSSESQIPTRKKMLHAFRRNEFLTPKNSSQAATRSHPLARKSPLPPQAYSRRIVSSPTPVSAGLLQENERVKVERRVVSMSAYTSSSRRTFLDTELVLERSMEGLEDEEKEHTSYSTSVLPQFALAPNSENNAHPIPVFASERSSPRIHVNRLPSPLPFSQKGLKIGDTPTQDGESATGLFADDGYQPDYDYRDMPRTPSPLSSTDSVVIVQESEQLQPSFLRKLSCRDAISNEGGQQGDHPEYSWMSWASSPPRAIPALHGPPSLPYARCPSGAEGTLIEHNDLLGVIWGLHGRQAEATDREDDKNSLLAASPQLRVFDHSLPGMFRPKQHHRSSKARRQAQNLSQLNPTLLPSVHPPVFIAQPGDGSACPDLPFENIPQSDLSFYAAKSPAIHGYRGAKFPAPDLRVSNPRLHAMLQPYIQNHNVVSSSTSPRNTDPRTSPLAYEANAEANFGRVGNVDEKVYYGPNDHKKGPLKSFPSQQQFYTTQPLNLRLPSDGGSNYECFIPADVPSWAHQTSTRRHSRPSPHLTALDLAQRSNTTRNTPLPTPPSAEPSWSGHSPYPPVTRLVSLEVTSHPKDDEKISQKNHASPIRQPAVRMDADVEMRDSSLISCSPPPPQSSARDGPVRLEIRSRAAFGQQQLRKSLVNGPLFNFEQFAQALPSLSPGLLNMSHITTPRSPLGPPPDLPLPPVPGKLYMRSRGFPPPRSSPLLDGQQWQHQSPRSTQPDDPCMGSARARLFGPGALSPISPPETRREGAGARNGNTLLKKNPRSIPLARLVQRRLSSVPEEDISGAGVESEQQRAAAFPGGRSRLPGGGTAANAPIGLGLILPQMAMPKASTMASAAAERTAPSPAKAKKTAKKDALLSKIHSASAPSGPHPVEGQGMNEREVEPGEIVEGLPDRTFEMRGSMKKKRRYYGKGKGKGKQASANMAADAGT